MSRLVWLATLSFVITGRISAQVSTSEQELPTIDSIIDHLNVYSDTVKSVSVSSRFEARYTLEPVAMPRGYPFVASQKIEAEWHLQKNFARVESKRVFDRIRPSGPPDGQVARVINPLQTHCHAITVFDWSQGHEKHLYLFGKSPRTVQKQGEKRHFDPVHIPPFEFVPISHGPATKFITFNGLLPSKFESYRGHELVVLESPPRASLGNGQIRYQTLFDPTKKCEVGRRYYRKAARDDAWFLYYQCVWVESELLDDVKLWFPKQVHVWHWAKTADGQRKPSHREHFVFDKWRINAPADLLPMSLEGALQFRHFVTEEPGPTTSRPE